jgi:gliding motility-associated-like protein
MKQLYKYQKILRSNALALWSKSPIFEILQPKLENMKGLSLLMKGLMVVFFTTVFSVNDVLAQSCVITFDGSACVGVPIRFTGSASGTGHEWTFTDGGVDNKTNGLLNLNFAFKTAGNNKVTYITTVNGSKCTATLNITIKESPKIKLSIVTLDSQCFLNNLFCFTDSTSNKNGAKIVNTKYVVSDGQLFEYDFPPSVIPNQLCFSIQDVRGGSFDLYTETVDENGCVDTMNWKGAVFVREKLGAAFTSNKPVKCDSVEAKIKNISRISQSSVKSIVWYWGDGSTSTEWGPDISKWFYKQGVYNSKMVIETFDGCKDSFRMTATATVFLSKVKILTDKDSTCISAPEIKFRVDQVPAGATGYTWNFGDPSSGPQNINVTTWSPAHAFTGLGPFLIRLSYTHPICGPQVTYDTIIILGPSSGIETAFQRVPDWQVFQCPKDIMDTVFFTRNLSTFYHNDRDYTDDDSTFYKAGGSALGHTFQSATVGGKPVPVQIWEKPIRNERNLRGDSTVYAGGTIEPGGGNDALKRERVCATRLWDFGDNFGSKCTTDLTQNKNINVNCAFSRDSTPYHYYKSWDLVLLSDFKSAPMEDAIFIDSNGLCKRVNIFPDTFFYIFYDTIVTIPQYSSDSAEYLASGIKGIASYKKEKVFKGKGERFIEDFVKMRLRAGDTAWVSPVGGSGYSRLIGPRDTLLRPKQTVQLRSDGDWAEFLYTVHLKRDTLPKSVYGIRTAKGEKPNIIDSFKRIPQGLMGFDYFINYERWRQLYYARIPACNNVQLTHKDTCHPLKCESVAIKQLSMLHANAGGVGSGLLKDAVECTGSRNPSYGVTFILSDLKPGCTFTDVQINYDTFCDPNAWVGLAGLSPGGRPLNPPLPFWNTGYQLAGNPPSRFSQTYGVSSVCNTKTSCVTVGIIVGNGIAKPGGNNAKRPLCQDTQYYDRFACFPIIDPDFEIVTPLKNALGDYKICKWDEVIARPIKANKTKTTDLLGLRWEFRTGDAAPTFSRSWLSYIQEEVLHYQKNVPGKDSNYLYNYIIQTRGTEDPNQEECSDQWVNGKSKVTSGPDTLFTAEIRDYTVAADVSAVWDNIKGRLEERGFDPFAVADTTIAKMIWNNKGVIGSPSSGAYGCIDTAGFGKDIRFYFIPNPDSTTVLHHRDSTIIPLDSWVNPLTKQKIAAYRFVPRWSGFHILELSMRSKNGKCDDLKAFPLIVGFAMGLKISDTLVCQDQGSSLRVAPDYRYFSTDPQNIGQFDPNFYWNPDPAQNPFQYDYWKDAARIAARNQGDTNKEFRTRWDWSKADDDINNPLTIFGGSPYGGAGSGTTNNPWVQLGGGSNLYYTNDSGVYTFRNIAGDSTGCLDTITKRVFISRLDVKFDLNLDVPSCNSVIEFFDSAVLHDPCNWAIVNCDGPGPVSCDFINKWFIDWGDGRDNYYERNSANLPGLPPRIAHKYTRNGWFKIKYRLTTKLGCEDTFSRWIKIPGPRPAFEFTTKGGNFVTICAGDSIEFTNTTDSAGPQSDWTWFFGDGEILNSSIKQLYHTYKNPGLYRIFLQQYDSLIVPPNIRKFCPAIFPDTPFQAAFTVLVLPRDSVRGFVLRPSICPGDSNIFVDSSDAILKVYKWKFEHYSSALGQWVTDTATTTNKRYAKMFSDPGIYRVTHYAEYDPSHPRPWCPTDLKTMNFTVDSVESDFDIDSSNKPDFVFTRTDVNGVDWRWGFGHQYDITKSLPNTFIQNLQSGDKQVSWSYDSSNVYWVCLITKNSTGCEDTICKKVTVDLFVYLANVFTPGNADNKNDDFRVPIQGHDIFEIRIFNRWGERVFFSEDPKVRWNGKINNDGPEAPSGTYFYQLEYRFKGKEKVNRVNGSVNLIRPN